VCIFAAGFASAVLVGARNGEQMAAGVADVLDTCDEMARTGAFPFLCPKCGASGLASRLRTVCGLPVATDGSDGAWMEWTEVAGD